MNIYVPYTYLIGWTKQNRYYYGVRFAKNCNPSDLWKTYFTSSKHVKNFRSHYGEPDIISVRKKFPNDSGKAKDWEEKVLRKMNVIKDERFLNKNVNGKFIKEGPQSKSHVEKRVVNMIRTKSKRGNLNRAAWTKETNPVAAEKVKKSLRGKKKSSGHIANMKFHINNLPIHECQYCGKTGDLRNMKRWHFDRCKKNPKRKTDLDKVVCCFNCGHTTIQSANFFLYHNENCKNQSQSEL